MVIRLMRSTRKRTYVLVLVRIPIDAYCFLHVSLYIGSSLFYLCRFMMRPRGASGQALASHRWGPDFASRSLHVGFVVHEKESGQVSHGVSPVFPYHKFHSTISPHSSHPFRFISSGLVMVRQAWSVGILATHGPIIWVLHRISSLDPTLCRTRVEDIYLCRFKFFYLTSLYYAYSFLSYEIFYTVVPYYFQTFATSFPYFSDLYGGHCTIKIRFGKK